MAPATGAQLPVSFGVPAAYFYALGANLPVQVPPDQRYRMACADTVVRALAELTAAFGSGLIGDSYQVGNTGPAVNPAQAARRLAALGVPTASTIPAVPDDSGTAAHGDRLARLSRRSRRQAPPPPGRPTSPGTTTPFWPFEATARPAAFLEVVLCALTQGYVLAAGASRPPAPPPPPGTTLADEIQAFLATITAAPTVATLAGVTADQWTSYFQPTQGYLPPYTRPGNQAVQIAAFIRYVQKFFELTPPALPTSYSAPPPGGPPALAPPSTDWLQACLTAYQGIAGGGTPVLGAGFNAATMQQAAAAVFPGDPAAQGWAAQALQTLDQLWALATALPAAQHPARVLHR